MIPYLQRKRNHTPRKQSPSCTLYLLQTGQVSDAAIQAMMAEQARRFLEDAPTTAAEASKIILDGVKAERWRILVGDDAHRMDALVRADPEQAYEPAFFDRLAKEVGWQLNGIVSNSRD